MFLTLSCFASSYATLRRREQPTMTRPATASAAAHDLRIARHRSLRFGSFLVHSDLDG